jgi:hypothetical protein
MPIEALSLRGLTEAKQVSLDSPIKPRFRKGANVLSGSQHFQSLKEANVNFRGVQEGREQKHLGAQKLSFIKYGHVKENYQRH